MKSPEFRIAVMLGGNLGNTKQFFKDATRLLKEKAGVLERASGIYVTAPWGIQDQPAFLNQALLIRTRLSPDEVLAAAKQIEQQLGRMKREVNGPREIDIDILLYGDLIYTGENLEIPHPRLHLRKFNLLPLAEIAPEWEHPVFHTTIAALLEACTDLLQVHKETTA